MLLRLTKNLTGACEGVALPGIGGIIELPDDSGRWFIERGHAEEVNADGSSTAPIIDLDALDGGSGGALLEGVVPVPVEDGDRDARDPEGDAGDGPTVPAATTRRRVAKKG